MREIRLIRLHVGPLATIRTVAKAGTYTVSTSHRGVQYRGAGHSLTQACARLLESLRGYPQRNETT